MKIIRWILLILAVLVLLVVAAFFYYLYIPVNDPPELFDNPWIPVVLEGSWQPEVVQVVTGQDDYVFVSDRMLVKHTNEYSSDNDDRVESNLPPDFFEGCDGTRVELGVDS